MERDIPDRVGTDRMFHQRGTTDEKSLDCPESMGGRASQRISVQGHSSRWVQKQ